ncbi:MAG: cation transporter [Planctomycetes bacterium]|nr:cation transporter [Planctomycetota bacterium]
MSHTIFGSPTMSGLLRRSVVSFVVFAFCFSLIGFTYAVEEKEKTNTVVTVSEMCGGCVKKINKRFEDEKDVAKIDCSIEKKTVTIIPKDGVKLSAKKIWEIMEGISKTPIRLVSPEGTFTSKPK